LHTVFDIADQLGIGQLNIAVIDGGRIREPVGRLIEHVDQGPRGSCRRGE
jgi:hypothetical protein